MLKTEPSLRRYFELVRKYEKHHPKQPYPKNISYKERLMIKCYSNNKLKIHDPFSKTRGQKKKSLLLFLQGLSYGL